MITRATDLSDAGTASGARILQFKVFGISAALVAATLVLSTPSPDQVRVVWGPEPAVSAATDEALPGEGRPPSPGPTDPDGLAG